MDPMRIIFVAVGHKGGFAQLNGAVEPELGVLVVRRRICHHLAIRVSDVIGNTGCRFPVYLDGTIGMEGCTGIYNIIVVPDGLLRNVESRPIHAVLPLGLIICAVHFFNTLPYGSIARRRDNVVVDAEITSIVPTVTAFEIVGHEYGSRPGIHIVFSNKARIRFALKHEIEIRLGSK